MNKVDPLFIWHELDTTRRPINSDEVVTVMKGSKAGKLAATTDYRSHLEVLSEYAEVASSPWDDHAMTPEYFIGLTIGLRAAADGRSLSGKYDSGFQVSGREMIQLRLAKTAGTHLAENYPGLTFGSTFTLGLSEGQHEGRPFPYIDEIGHAIGIRAVQLGATV